MDYKKDFDLLIKGKVAQVGEERTWSNGKKYKKTAQGWVPVGGSQKPAKKEDTKPRDGKHEKTKDGWKKTSKPSERKSGQSESKPKREPKKKGAGRVAKHHAKKTAHKTKKTVKQFAQDNKKLFDTGEHAHPHRSAAAKFLRAKGKGLVKGLKHEIHHIKDAGSAIKGLFQGKKPNAHQQKALKKVGITLGLTVASMMVTGGVGGIFAKGGVQFMKALGLHFVEHVVAETTILSAIFAKAENGEEVSDEELQKLMDAFINWIEQGDWSGLPDKLSDNAGEDIEKSQYINDFKILGL